jgi:hypothetical protein
VPPQPVWTVSSAVYRILVAAVSAVAIATGALTVLGGLTPWFFLLVCWAAGVAILAPTVGWSTATWLVVGGALLSAQWVMVVNPRVGLPLDAAQVAAMLAGLVVAAIVVVVRARDEVTFARPRVVDALAAVLPAAASAVLLLVAGLVRGSASVTWAMAGDAQFNTVLARIIAGDGGATRANVEVVSLVQGLMAMVHLPGRGRVAGDDLLIHDIVRQADLWLLMILLSSVLGGAIAALVLREATVWIRVLGILGATALPLSWHLNGYSITAGFYNVSLAYLALELCVFFWLALREAPWVRLAVLFGMTTVLLGAWTPLAVIPGMLVAGAGLVALRRKPHPVAILAAILGALQLVAFAVFFILPTFVSSGSALSAEGTILGLARSLFIALMAVLVVLALALLAAPRGAFTRTYAGGSLLVAAGAAVGVGFLYFQNRHLPEPWIYYPIKFAWIALELGILLSWLAIALLLREGGARRLLALGVTGLAVVQIATLNPPRYPGRLSYVPLVQIALDPPASEEALPILSDYAGERVVFSRFLGEEDTFMNQWQFQLTVRAADEQIRSFAYRVVETQVDFCDAAEAWGGDMAVITDDARWAVQLNAACGDLLDAHVVSPPGR